MIPVTLLRVPNQRSLRLIRPHLTYVGRYTTACSRFTKLRWVGKHVNIKYYVTDEPSNPKRPTQPKKIRLKVAFGPLFFQQQTIFRGLGLAIGNRLLETKPNQILRKHPYHYNQVPKGLPSFPPSTTWGTWPKKNDISPILLSKSTTGSTSTSVFSWYSYDIP